MNMNIFAQIINGIGSTFSMIGINLKNKRTVLLFFIIGNTCVATALGLLGAKSGMILQIIFVIETIINFFWEKNHDKYPPWLILIYLVLPVIILLLNFKTPWDILVIIASIVFPLALLSKDLKLRLLNLLSILLWIPYNIRFNAIVGAIACTIFAIMNIIAIIRLDVRGKYVKEQESNNI